MRAGIVYAALLATVLASPSFAADVTVKNFVGQITLIEGNDGLDVVKVGSKGDLEHSDRGEAILIDGGLSRKERGKACNGGSLSWDLDFNGKRSQYDRRLKDYPELLISIPAGSNLTIRDSYVWMNGEVDLNQADLSLSGCFDTQLGVIQDLGLELSGSGDFEADRVDHAVIEKSGAGDMEFKKVTRVQLEQSGAGDIEFGYVTESLSIDKSGSGDIDVDRADGVISISKSGSGDIDVKSGAVTDLRIENSGSGDVDIRTGVEEAKVYASGSGDVYIESVEGVLYQEVSGSADLNLGDD